MSSPIHAAATDAGALAEFQYWTYHAVKQEAMERSAADPGLHEHRQILRDVLGEIRDCVPFPASMVRGNDHYALQDKVIEIAPHAFELASLIDKLNWSVRLALTKGPGSGTKMPDALASRGASMTNTDTLRWLETSNAVDHDYIRGLGFGAAVLQGGNCGENAAVAVGLAQSLDDAMLKDLGVEVDLSKLLFVLVGDSQCDHSYAIVHHADDGPCDPTAAEHLHRLWSIDPHQLYPMPCRYDNARYNHPHVDALFPMPGPRLPSLAPEVQAHRLDLGAARFARERLQAELGRGWADQPDRIPSKRLLRQHPAVAAALRAQNVSDYLDIDPSQVPPQARAELERQIASLHRTVVDRSFVAHAQGGNVRETWQGLCLPNNPNVVYRNRATGELLAPTVPAHYLEKTEQPRWAWDVYQRPPRVAASGPPDLIPAAVQAIEQEPFLGALAAARALDYSANSPLPGQIATYTQALKNLEQWIDRMFSEASAAVFQRVRSVGLQDQTVRSLRAVERNLDRLEQLATTMQACSLPGSPHHAWATELRHGAADSPARPRVRALIDMASYRPVPRQRRGGTS
jgi:hypothetical protein